MVRKSTQAAATPSAAKSSKINGVIAEEVSRQGIKLGFLIHDVSRMRRNAFDQIMRPIGVTRAQWWVLAHLSRHDGMMQTQLADVLDVGKASLGTLIERLEQAGLVERTSDPTDKRAKRVFLSRAAQQLVRRMTNEEDRFNQQILGKLSSTERDDLIRLLDSVKTALSEIVTAEHTAEAY
jgi:MarR family transcriptional regulator, transcriptional regulator for hemolysin